MAWEHSSSKDRQNDPIGKQASQSTSCTSTSMIYGTTLRSAHAGGITEGLHDRVEWAPISQTCHASLAALHDGRWRPCSGGDQVPMRSWRSATSVSLAWGSTARDVVAGEQHPGVR